MSEKIVKFGKSSAGLLEIKKSFFEQNDRFLQYQRSLGEIYTAQPRRTMCMCCAGTIEGRSFAKQGIDYVICPRCTHLNGVHEDTDAFASAVYTGAGVAEYGELFYSAQDRAAYDQRKQTIYAPKVEFLLSSLAVLGEAPDRLRYCDFGAGSGYMVGALSDGGVDAFGYEVSDAQILYGNAMLGRDALRPLTIAESEGVASTVDCDVLILIGVLEHLRRPRELLRFLTANQRVRYLMISVPLYSPTVFFEMIFSEVMQRQLSGGHTHLYTPSSLDWMAAEFALEPVAEWWFGTDLVDLYRSLLVELRRTPATEQMTTAWATMFGPMIDELQLVLDRRQQSSEVHIIYRVH